MSKKSVAVRIAGNEYKIRSDSDGKLLRQIATYVDQTMERVRKETGTVDSLDVAILACLNLGRENLSLKNQRTEETSEASLRALIDRVEAVVPGLSAEDDSSRASDTADTTTADTTTADTTTADTTTADTTEAAAQSDPTEKASSGKKTTKSETTHGPATTLELPSVESLRERSAKESNNPPASSAEEDVLPEARVAAGGRDRAS
jgi:cell division protein ZapA (FtsZ GTPase activity inhibitor)